jgi:hypothetical protein
MARNAGHNISVKETTGTAAITVEQNPIAKLMYYMHLNCLNSIVNLTLDRRLIKYHNWELVHEDDLTAMIELRMALDPKMLAEKGVLLWDRDQPVCRPGENHFFSITDDEGGNGHESPR